MKEMNNKELPIKTFSFIIPNPEYNPDEFSQEIENSEEFIDELKMVSEEIKKPYFDFGWNNTLFQLPRNSEKWRENHSKICPVKIAAFRLYGSCTNHSNGRRDYYSEELLEKIMDFAEKNGGIIDLC